MSGKTKSVAMNRLRSARAQRGNSRGDNSQPGWRQRRLKLGGSKQEKKTGSRNWPKCKRIAFTGSGIVERIAFGRRELVPAADTQLLHCGCPPLSLALRTPGRDENCRHVPVCSLQLRSDLISARRKERKKNSLIVYLLISAGIHLYITASRQ